MIHSIKNACFSLPQYLLPQHALSRIMHHLTRSEIKWWKNFAIRSVVSLYRVNLGESGSADYAAYPSFNHFFTRELKESVRPVSQDDNVVVSPADGAVSQIGTIDRYDIIQAKGRRFGLSELLGGEQELAGVFAGGSFATIYLSPRDYHRAHMPCRGILAGMRHIPGRLFSVNNATAAVVPNLFAKNERVVAIFETPLGKMALVLIGAIFVSSIETVWHGVVTPPRSRSMRTWNYGNNPVILQQGQEMGRFNMGSTVIALFERDRISWSSRLQAESILKMGQPIGYRHGQC